MCARAGAGGRTPRPPRPPPTSFTPGSRGRSVLARAFRYLSCACAQVSVPGGGGNPARSRHILSSALPALGHTALAQESREARVAGSRTIDSSCQPVGRSSRRPSPSPFPGGGAVESAPRIPQWGRSGDGGSGITEQERERPQAPIPCGGHGRPSPRPQPGRHRPVCPAGERAAPQLRPGSYPCRRGAGSCKPHVLLRRPLRQLSPPRRPSPLSWASAAAVPLPFAPLLSPLAADSGSQFSSHPVVPRPHTICHLHLCSGSGPPASKVFEGQPSGSPKRKPPSPAESLLWCPSLAAHLLLGLFSPLPYLRLLPPPPLSGLLEF